MPRTKGIAFGLTLVVFAASWIAPRWPVEQAMHSSLTVLGLAWLWWHDRRWPLRPVHFALICAFIVAHCIGARWLYSYVPYDAWLQAAPYLTERELVETGDALVRRRRPLTTA